eukprot:CAMPEP_0171276706 /NCGR_PEP_ID=MMETSP0790-20130122/63978_1 /TAXON_ID=2925 /ORGANISM="Alexandrium catenella, Strain OF101" /LENGTH=86 /DNA_ID=CAMNT_0011745813 /DNA_START=34 /DNA_END=291 /DNA_ORIENTATION=-
MALFMAISGGDDWRNFVECFKREPAWGVYVTLFSIYIAFATMVMANLVTGYFVDGAQKMMNAEEEDHLKGPATTRDVPVKTSGIQR